MGKKITIIVIVLLLISGLSLIAFFAWKYLHPKKAGLSIDSSPTVQVYIDDTRVGNTPYEITRNPGEVIIKLVSPNSNLTPFQTRVILVSGVTTVIRREFGATDDDASGAVLSFERITAGDSSLAVISSPDAAQVAVDGTVKGFTPYKSSSLVAGEHELTLSAPGFLDKMFQIRTHQGYKLTAIFKLAKDNKSTLGLADPEIQPTPTPQPKTMIEILTTPTGFLRVRSAASSSSEEITQVKPGEQYPLIEEVKEWFKIEIQPAVGDQPSEVGWVSSKYSRKIDPNLVVNPSPTSF